MFKITAILAFCLLAISQPTWAFYCGTSLVSEGDYKLQVLEKCGQPTYGESRVAYVGTTLRGSGINQPGLDLSREEPVQIEEWTYDFGQRSFMLWLHFENGRLTVIKNLGYGSR